MPVFILASAFASASTDFANPFDMNEQSQLQPVGSGKLHWFGFTIYEASLWTANGNYDGIENNLPLALHITYRRDIDSKALVQRTVEEWKQLDIFSNEKRKSWGKRLESIWPSVKPGDSITTLFTEKKQTRFYHNSRFIDAIDEPEFGISLLSIWLHPETSEPDLREKLIGQRKS